LSRLVLPLFFGVFAAMLGVAVIPGVSGPVGPTTVSMRLFPGDGETRLRLTPLGTIAAQTHSFPTRIELALVEADVEALARAATSPDGRDELRNRVSGDLTNLALRAGIQSSVSVCLLAAAGAALLFGRHLRFILVTTGGCLVTVASMAWIITGSFDSKAFSQPTFSGPVAKAQQVIEVVARGEEVLDQTRSRFDVASQRLSELFVLLASPDEDPLHSGTALLHVSDIHANPIGFEITRRLADEFDVDAILDTGDLGSAELDTGGISSAIDPIDSAIAREISRMGVPYLYVAGNHDSPQLRRRVAGVDNVTMLDSSVATVDLLEIMGFADPSFSATAIAESVKSQQRAAISSELAEEVSEEDPDILAVHDSVLASASWGSVPLVLAGHTHEKGESEEGGTLLLTVGSTGATGLKHLTVESGRRYEAQILYFDGTELIAVDYVSLADVGGDFELSRRTYR
jgi:predicted phosphodiesterase